MRRCQSPVSRAPSCVEGIRCRLRWRLQGIDGCNCIGFQTETNDPILRDELLDSLLPPSLGMGHETLDIVFVHYAHLGARCNTVKPQMDTDLSGTEICCQHTQSRWLNHSHAF